jgi:hypothetical protein
MVDSPLKAFRRGKGIVPSNLPGILSGVAAAATVPAGVASGEAEGWLPVVWYSRDPPLAILRG